MGRSWSDDDPPYPKYRRHSESEELRRRRRWQSDVVIASLIILLSMLAMIVNPVSPGSGVRALVAGAGVVAGLVLLIRADNHYRS